MNTMTVIVMALGAAIILIGIALIVARRNETGSALLRFMGAEFNASGGTGYMVFIVGVGVFLTPVIRPLPDLREKPTTPIESSLTTPGKANSTASSTQSRTTPNAASAEATQAQKSSSETQHGRTWIATEGRGYLLNNLNIEETESGDSYIWIISGIYPSKAPSPSKSVISYGVDSHKNEISSLNSWQEIKINPGDEFKIKIQPTKASISLASDVRICIGPSSCYPSPNLLDNRPKL